MMALVQTCLSLGCVSTAEPPLAPARPTSELIVPPPKATALEGAVLWGKLLSLDGSVLLLGLRQGGTAQVELGEALKLHRMIALKPGENLMVNGTITDGVLHARLVTRAKGESSWGADKPN